MKRLSHFECIRYNRDDIWERGQFAEITIDTNCAQYIKIYQNNRGNAVDEKAKPLERAALPHLFYAGRRIGGHAADPLLFCRAVAQTPLRSRNGTVIIGIVLGIAVAACSLRDFLRLTERKARESERKEKWH